MKKLTINMLHLTKQPEGQGVASATKEQINLLKEMAKDEFIIKENQMRDGDINHFHQIDPKMYLRIKKSKAISVMHVHFLPETLQGSIKVPGPIMSLFKRYFLDYYRSADYLVVVNPIFIEPLTTFQITKERIKYIPNYVSKKDFYPQNQSIILETKQKYNIDPQKFVVLGVGQVQTRKGVLDFIEVAKALPHIQFVWAGGFSFGAITDGYKELKDVVDNPPSNVIFTDIIPRTQMNSILNIADCLFMPSYNELFPMAILEACNLDIPMVLRDLELYEDILFKKYLRGSNNQEFTQLITKLANDPDFYQMASQFSNDLSNTYSKENVSKQWITFYQDIYTKHKPTHVHRVNQQTFEEINSNRMNEIIVSSRTKHSKLHDAQVGDSLIIKHSLPLEKDHLVATITDVKHYHNCNDIEFLSDQQKKKHANKAYLSIIKFKLD